MPLKDWTVLVVPHNDVQVHRFRISRWVLGGGLTVLAAGLAVLAGLMLSTCNEHFDYLSYINLQRENRILNQKLGEVQNKITLMNQKVSDLMEENQVFRRIAGLETLDREVREVGVGGAYRGGFDELYEINPPLAREIQEQQDQISLLLRKADLIDQSLGEAVRSIEEDSDKWKHTPSIMPADGYISSFFGRRSHPIYHVSQVHNGIDISCREGTPIVAPADGKVVMTKNQIGYGLTVVIDHGFGYRTRYAHCLKSNVRYGQQVKRGDVIAFVGQSGITTGPNLHYEVYDNGVPRDPLSFILDNNIP